VAKRKIPSALDMRHLKYGGAPEAERDRTAEALRAEGRRAEAILLFEDRPDHPFLDEEARWAVAEGVAFHLLSLRRMGRAVADEEIRACAEAAESRGRWLDARSCWVELGDEAALARIAEHLPESLRPQQKPDEAEDV
jgi:hypothetical protein